VTAGSWLEEGDGPPAAGFAGVHAQICHRLLTQMPKLPRPQKMAERHGRWRSNPARLVHQQLELLRSVRPRAQLPGRHVLDRQTAHDSVLRIGVQPIARLRAAIDLLRELQTRPRQRLRLHPCPPCRPRRSRASRPSAQSHLGGQNTTLLGPLSGWAAYHKHRPTFSDLAFPDRAQCRPPCRN